MSMNNEQKNTYVKKQILIALLDLLKEKSLTDISVSELTSRAEIGRVSFYRNYQNKEDILKEESDRLIKEWGRLYESNPESSPESLYEILLGIWHLRMDAGVDQTRYAGKRKRAKRSLLTCSSKIIKILFVCHGNTSEQSRKPLELQCF